MNKRILKKKLKNARLKYISDKVGTIERGYLADYFRNYPHDFSLFRKMNRDNNYGKYISKDIRDGYKHPTYSASESVQYQKILRRTDFRKYCSMSLIGRLNYDLHALACVFEG